ncbi:MAG: hypothetical protein HYS45_01605 [Parcubacteria group bacterium]|nr:hypothetical protein [Parcubacteria group bacterium]
MVRKKQIDLIVVSTLIIAGAGITVLFSLTPLALGLLTLLIPSAYLIARKKKNPKKIVLAVVIFGAIFGFIFDFIVTLNEGWIVTRLMFPVRLFDFYPLVDDIIGFMLMTLMIVVFYEHFLDDEKNPRVSKNAVWSVIPSVLILIFILALYIINPALLSVPYVYLIGGAIAIVFPLYVALRKPKITDKLFKIAAFFFFVWLVLELAALKTEGWIFTGEYIGSVEIIGLVFPFEELFFWMMWYAASVVVYYEYYIDDKK